MTLGTSAGATFIYRQNAALPFAAQKPKTRRATHTGGTFLANSPVKRRFATNSHTDDNNNTLSGARNADIATHFQPFAPPSADGHTALPGIYICAASVGQNREASSIIHPQRIIKVTAAAAATTRQRGASSSLMNN